MVKRNGNWKIAALILALVGLLVGGVTGYTKAMVRIAVTETDVEYIQEDIKEIKGGIIEILKAVRG